MLPQNIQKQVEKNLNCKVLQSTPLYGGDINRSYKLDTNNGVFFIKYNDNKLYPNMFKREANGLQLMASTQSIKIPKVITTGATENEAYLILTYIDSSTQKQYFWEEFGMQLAEMHKATHSQFGLNEDNYIGTLPQSNKQYNSFIDFFIYERLEAQLNIADITGKTSPRHHKGFEKLYKLLPDLIPNEPPALLHGDLWSGNYMVNEKGEPCLIDPAVYYGHREIDLAMTTLFGRFDPAFYHSYNENFRLEHGWKNRLSIFNLYPLMVHVNLFGGGYLDQVESILRYYN